MDFSKRGFSLFRPERLIRSVVLAPIVLFAALLFGAGPASAQTRNFPFRATNYDVQVIIHPENQTISALAKVDFVANEVGRTVLVELHPDLQISSVKDAAGHQLTFGRDG